MMRSHFMRKNNQIDRSDLVVVNAQSKAAEQIEKERKKIISYLNNIRRFL